MKRKERLDLIKKIIEDHKIGSQEQLMAELSARGLEVAQSTVSRDMQFLNLVKVRDSSGVEHYAADGKYSDDPRFSLQRIKAKFREEVSSIQIALNIIVIKTNPGEAQGVAAAIDGGNFKAILGTVAGDDTILCITVSEKNAEEMALMFRDF